MKQSTTITPKNYSTIRVNAKFLSIMSAVALTILCITIFIGGFITSIATGPFALLLIPVVLIVTCIVELVGAILIIFFYSIIISYANTVDNIQTITNIIVNEQHLKGADKNENADASNSADGGTN